MTIDMENTPLEKGDEGYEEKREDKEILERPMIWRIFAFSGKKYVEDESDHISW